MSVSSLACHREYPVLHLFVYFFIYQIVVQNIDVTPYRYGTANMSHYYD